MTSDADRFFVSRRSVLIGSIALASVSIPTIAFSQTPSSNHSAQGEIDMGFVTTKDGTEIFYKDWGPKDAQPIVFHHGWPLSSDDWDAQML
ncbi:alpha/beta fold hydrolase, partial [Agrobacterium pusense]